MYCTNCGYKNADNAKFCQGCGATRTPVTEKNITSGNNSAETNEVRHIRGVRKQCSQYGQQ